MWRRTATYRRRKLAIRTLSRRCSGAAGRGRRTRRCDVPFAREFIGYGAERPAASLRRHRRHPFGLRTGHPDGGRGRISAQLHISVWGGLFVPKGTPKSVIAKLNAAAITALADPTVRRQLANIGQEVVP